MLTHSRFKTIILVLVSFVLAACSYSFIPSNDFFESDVSKTFATVLEIISEDDVDGLSDIGVPEFSGLEKFDETMGKILEIAGDPRNAQLILAENRKVDSSKDAENIFYAAYEYQNDDKFEILQIALQEVDGECCKLRHIQFNQDEFQRSSYNDFGTHELTFKRAVFLALMVFTVAFIVIVVFFIIRDKYLKKKWLWVLFALFGMYGATLNWTTAEISPNFISMNSNNGGVHFSLIKFNLLGGGFSRTGLFQPWIFDWGFPFGAVFYVIKRRFRKRNSNPA